MNSQLRIAFVLAFSVIGGGALAENDGAVGTPTSKAGQAVATAAHFLEAPQVEAHDVSLPEAPRQAGNGVEAPQVEADDAPEAPHQEGNGVEAPQVEAHDVPLPEAPRQEGNGVEAPQVGTFTAKLSPLVGSRP
jgi:biotin carboxyl carrier protein